MKNIDIDKYMVTRKSDLELSRFLDGCTANLQNDYEKALKNKRYQQREAAEILLNECYVLRSKIINGNLEDCDFAILQRLVRYNSLKQKEMFLIAVMAIVLTIVSVILSCFM